mgnify:CR=1 FL=1
MATRKSIYLAAPSDSALHARYGNDPAMCDNGQLNYSRAVNAALEEWQQATPAAKCPKCNNTGWPTAAADANFHAYCQCTAGKRKELADLQAQTGQITARIAQLIQDTSQ